MKSSLRPIEAVMARAQQQADAQNESQPTSSGSDQDLQPATASQVVFASEDDSEHTSMPDSNAVLSRYVGGKRKRLVQHVVTRQSKLVAINWLVEEEVARGGAKVTATELVKTFGGCFRSPSAYVNYMKAHRWWNEHHAILSTLGGGDSKNSYTTMQMEARRKVLIKTLPGRGRKRDLWTDWLHNEPLEEFHRLQKASLKFSPSVLVLIAKHLLEHSAHPMYSRAFTPPQQESTFYDKINVRWIQSFQERFSIVQRMQCGRKQHSPEMEALIEKEVASHLGQLKRDFEDGILGGVTVENMDETHFIIDMNNGKILGIKGDTHVKYAEVVPSTAGMTMMVHLTGGSSSEISTSVMIFCNPTCSYHDSEGGIRDDQHLRSVAPREACWGETRTVAQRIIWVDNYSAHTVSDELKQQLAVRGTEIRVFPPNATHLVQPADSFVISKIKDAWVKRWGEKKRELIEGSEWQDTVCAGGSWSGALRNPGKKYFLLLAADSVRDTNSQWTKRHSITYARKAMIRCGLARGLDGEWCVEQLSDELRRIVDRYQNHILGAEVLVESGPAAREKASI